MSVRIHMLLFFVVDTWDMIRNSYDRCAAQSVYVLAALHLLQLQLDTSIHLAQCHMLHIELDLVMLVQLVPF